MAEFDSCYVKQISYLRARDPSILTGNIAFDNIRVNLALDNLQECSSASEQKDFIEIHLRIKKIQCLKTLYEFDSNTITCHVPEGSNCLRNVKEGDNVTRKYKFTKIFGPQTSQVDIFNVVVKPKLLQFINGKSSSLLTYGASGSGKTFTIVGTANEPGVVPRALEYLFRTLPKLSEETTFKPDPIGNVVFLNPVARKEEKNRRTYLLNHCNSTVDKKHAQTYKAMQERLSPEPVGIVDDASDVVLGVWVSFAEIYNENIYDLLKPEPPRGKTREKLSISTLNGQVFIKNLITVNISSGLEAYQILQYGLHNLKYASTCVNSHSSRSHSIFTIKLVQGSRKDQEFSISYFNFCDLAGSERVKKTLNVGERLKESNNINTSLLVLGRCMSSIRLSQKNNDSRLIPFRESKLTQLFQRALSGQEDISMIVNINPEISMFDESQHVLNFAAIAKDIIVQQQPKVVVKSQENRFSKYMQLKNANVATIPEEEQTSEIEHLKKLVNQLYAEIEDNRIEYEENELKSRAQILSDYDRIIEQLNKNWAEQLADCEKMYIERNREEIELLKYETLLKDSKRAKVICLDSSSDEEEENRRKLDMAKLNRRVNELQAEVTRLTFETQAKQGTVNQLNERVSKLNQTIAEQHEQSKNLKIQNIDYEAILQDAQIQLTQMEEDHKKELEDLRAEVHLYREKLMLLQDRLGDNYFTLNTEIEDNYSNHGTETQDNDLMPETRNVDPALNDVTEDNYSNHGTDTQDNDLMPENRNLDPAFNDETEDNYSNHGTKSQDNDLMPETRNVDPAIINAFVYSVNPIHK